VFLIDLRSCFDYLKPIGIRLIFFKVFPREREFLSFLLFVPYKILSEELDYEAGE